MELNGSRQPVVWPQYESIGHRRRRSPVSVLFSLPAIILTYTIAFLLISVFIVPPFLSIISTLLRPVFVKRSWDSVNMFLVLFAILCGVFARWNDDGITPSSHGRDERSVASGSMNAGQDIKITSPELPHWFSDVYAADRLKIYESVRSSASSLATGTGRLRRSSNSYPDMRQEFSDDIGDHHHRFYDDFELNKYRSPVITNLGEGIRYRPKIQIEESEPTEVQVDKFDVSLPPPPRESPAPPQSPSAEVSQKPRRTHRPVRIKTTVDANSAKSNHAHPPPPPPPPAPYTPPRTVLRYEAERKQGRLERRKSNAAKEIKMVISSLYNQRKRKRKSQKARSSKQRNESPDAEPPTVHYRSTIPHPPPLPPPPRSSPSMFYGLFKKGSSKSKKVHSAPAPPPPPPLPPAPSPPPRQRTGKPPRPTTPTNYEKNHINSNRKAPLTPIPPPPPPPPFRVPPLKFVVRGDFAKIKSNQSSTCSSPEREVIDPGWGLELTQSDSGAEMGRCFYPSPDVNTKADSFIARLRDEWRLEKIYSVNEKIQSGSN